MSGTPHHPQSHRPTEGLASPSSARARSIEAHLFAPNRNCQASGTGSGEKRFDCRLLPPPPPPPPLLLKGRRGGRRSGRRRGVALAFGSPGGFWSIRVVGRWRCRRRSARRRGPGHPRRRRAIRTTWPSASSAGAPSFRSPTAISVRRPLGTSFSARFLLSLSHCGARLMCRSWIESSRNHYSGRV